MVKKIKQWGNIMCLLGSVVNSLKHRFVGGGLGKSVIGLVHVLSWLCPKFILHTKYINSTSCNLW